MMSSVSNEEKKRLAYERQNAVRNAWKEEKSRVEAGYGTRNWSQSECEELLERGSVAGYEGHHMKSVSLYPEYAGDSKNIQFLTEDEHLYGAHQGNYHYATNGYYDPATSKMIEFDDDELREIPTVVLTNSQQFPDKLSVDEARESYYKEDAEPKLSEDELSSELEAIKASYDTADSADESSSNMESISESNENSYGIHR